ncbi:MAG: hypothetical protein FWF59_01385 [Turicibacter sp.]|nr:hypothetical protein [Turicibacter sp.]
MTHYGKLEEFWLRKATEGAQWFACIIQKDGKTPDLAIAPRDNLHERLDFILGTFGDELKIGLLDIIGWEAAETLGELDEQLKSYYPE